MTRKERRAAEPAPRVLVPGKAENRAWRQKFDAVPHANRFTAQLGAYLRDKAARERDAKLLKETQNESREKRLRRRERGAAA